ncbi:MAG: YihY/virulence factor BrkB family protein [Deltaproteobacteria bacterium]|nr:YihY/virulence factor BrkB family protein [Deltaproteobacteria bacterium]
MSFTAIVRDSGRIFLKRNCLTSAAAISFYAFFSLIPLLFLMTAGLGFVLGSRPDLQDRIIILVSESVPYLTPRIASDLKDLSLNWKTFGWVGLLVFLSGAELVVGEAAKALMEIFGTENRFGFFRQKVVNLTGVLIGVLAAVASIALTAASYYLEAVEANIFGLGYVYTFYIIFFARFIAPFLLLVCVVAFVFKLLSGPEMDMRNAFFGSAIFTILWELAKQLFTVYVTNFDSYNKFYGSIGTLMIFLLWIFYSANIFLFAASSAIVASRSGAHPRHVRHVRPRKR